MAPLCRHDETSILLIDWGVEIKGEHQRIDLLVDQKTITLLGSAIVAADVRSIVARQSPDESAPGLLFGSTNLPNEAVTVPPAVSALSIEAVCSYLIMGARPYLFLGGLWLEDTVTFAALDALAHGFDTYLLTDLTICRHDNLRAAAMDRLLQAGVVPTTVRQMVAEWLATSQDRNVAKGLTDRIRDFDQAD